jgi:membrane fusion protein (multidrug efflux system)
MKIWKQFAVSLVLLAAAGGGYHVYQTYVTAEGGGGERKGRRGGDVPVIVSPVSVQRIEEQVEAVGTTRASQAVEIVPLASGRVVDLTFDSGQQVAEGAILLTLDDDIEKANLDEAEAKLKQTQLALERAESLRRNKTVSQAQLDQLTAENIGAQAARDRAARRLADRTVRAPFAGVTGLRRVDIGARIDDNSVITTLDDLSKVEVEFQLPELLYGKIRRGLEITATSATFPGRTFPGKVINVDSRIDETARAFRVRAVMPNPELVLPAGMFMTISVVLESRDAMMIPEAAVIFEGATSFVYVVKDDKAQRRDVQLGQRRANLTEVVTGLQDGEMVVQRGTQNLRNGSAVKIIDSEVAPPAGNSDKAAEGQSS